MSDFLSLIADRILKFCQRNMIAVLEVLFCFLIGPDHYNSLKKPVIWENIT